MYKAMHQSMRDSEKLANLSDFAFRVWEMGCVASDLTGRITASPKRFWAQAMPLCNFDQTKLTMAFNELNDAKLIHRYDVDGKPYMVFHDHDEHNKGTKNLRNLRPACPPPSPSLCYCITYTKDEEGDSSTAVATADASAEPSTGVYVPSPVLVPVPVSSEGEGGLEEGEKWPPMPATNRGHLWKLFCKAHITGTPAQKRQYFEAWLAQAGASRLEQILMEPRIVGKDVFVIQRWYFNDMLKEAK